MSIFVRHAVHRRRVGGLHGPPELGKRRMQHAWDVETTARGGECWVGCQGC
jgi:hypothetical protein